MKKLWIILLFTSLLFAQNDARETGGVLSPEQAAYDVTFYDLSLDIDPDTQSLDGAVIIKAKIVDELSQLVVNLAPEFTVSTVDLLGKVTTPLSFQQTKSQVIGEFPKSLTKGDSFQVRISYSGKPYVAPNPPWDGGFTWQTTADGSPWIGVSCQLNGADLWWPCKDHPSDEPDSVKMHITIPQDLYCAANGVLNGIDQTVDKKQTFHWEIRNPINNYCVTVNIAPYTILSDTYKSITGEKIALKFYAIPEHVEKAETLLPEMKNQLDFFESTFGPYPFRTEKLGYAETPYYGMEHQTIISYGNNFQKNSYGFDYILLHESAHEWFGNLVTARDWKDVWLHEGFATYAEALYVEYMSGIEKYHNYVQEKLGTRNRSPICYHDAKTMGQAYTTDIYYKGARVLHMLRFLMGDEPFFNMLKKMTYPDDAHYYATGGSQTRLADTDEFITLVESITKTKLDWFFDVYLYQAKLPILSYYVDGNLLKLEWTANTEHSFNMPVEVETIDDTYRVEMENGKGQLELTDEFFFIDPQRWLLKSLLYTDIEDKNSLPTGFIVHHNYPNPFNDSTTIKFEIPQDEQVNIALYNSKGQFVQTFIDKRMAAGVHTFNWNAANFSSGTYHLKINAGPFQENLKCTLIK